MLKWSPERLRSLAVLVSLGLSLFGPVSAEEAATLKCAEDHFGPLLDFEFRFFAGDRLGIPIKEYRGRQPSFKILQVVTPINGTPGEPAKLFDEVVAQQPIPDHAKGEIQVNGSFAVGLGSYRVDWRIEDDTGKSCSGSWDFKADLSRSQRAVDLALEPGEVVESSVYLFRPELVPPRPHLEGPRRLKIFVSMDIRRRRGRVTRPTLWQIHPHLSTVRQLARSRGFNEFSVVMFSFEDQKVVHHQDYMQFIDFQPMRSVLDELDPQSVDIAQLGMGREMDFFESLLSTELLNGEPPDAVAFVGQETHFGKKLSEFMRDRLKQTGADFFFLDTSRFTWKGAMGNVVRAVDGREYRLRMPSDLSRAIVDIERRFNSAAN